MKNYIILLTILFLATFLNAQENVSCRDFTQTSVDILTENNFLPDGNFNSVRLCQGDKIEIYKPFYKGRDYMLIVTSEEVLPGIIVEVKDMTRKVILKSDKPEKLHQLNYTPDKNQNLIISVLVTKSEEYSAENKGCVSVVIGFSTPKNQ